MDNNYQHIQTAHCENGVVVRLLKTVGIEHIDEPMAFGIGSGLFYIHIPFLRLNNAPALAFRTMPGRIFKQSCNFLGVEYKSRRFSRPQNAEAYLDKLIEQGYDVGCQVGVFNLSYLPVEYRFHFNAHNLVVYGKEGDEYLISDTTMEQPTRLSAGELLKARYAHGLYAPKGHLYYIKKRGPVSVSDDRLREAVLKGIKRNVRDMLHVPGSFAGVSGIKYTGDKIRKWRDQLGVRKAGRYLGHIVRMQEEIGTGGGGFRFLYAAFLERSAELFHDEDMLSVSEDFGKAGDMWRASAVKMAGVFRCRTTEQEHFNEIGDLFYEISGIESQAFKRLSQIVKRYD